MTNVHENMCLLKRPVGEKSDGVFSDSS